jgi:bis(5'-nucleosyl)-tetraphosphatase (symmetrical)
MHFLIGDLQGCSDALDRLLAEIDFSPSRDSLHVLGDLVNRGPDSVGVLQRLVALGGAATCLLGNHDLHLLAVAAGAQKPHRSDTLQAVLATPAARAWLHWLRHCRVATGTRLAAGARRGAAAVERGADAGAGRRSACAAAQRAVRCLLAADVRQPARTLGRQAAGADRWRVIINALTRLRFCTADGTMEFTVKDNAAAAPPGINPGTTWRRGARRACRSHSATGRLWACSSGPVAVAGHRLRVGWAADRRAHRRRPARTLSSALQTRLVARRG